MNNERIEDLVARLKVTIVVIFLAVAAIGLWTLVASGANPSDCPTCPPHWSQQPWTER